MATTVNIFTRSGVVSVDSYAQFEHLGRKWHVTKGLVSGEYGVTDEETGFAIPGSWSKSIGAAINKSIRTLNKNGSKGLDRAVDKTWDMIKSLDLE